MKKLADMRFGDIVKVSVRGGAPVSRSLNHRYDGAPPNTTHVGRVFYRDAKGSIYVYFPQALPGIGVAYSSACRTLGRPIEPRPYGVLESGVHEYHHVLKIEQESAVLHVTATPPPRLGMPGKDVFDADGHPLGILIQVLDAERASVRTLKGDMVFDLEGMCYDDGAPVKYEGATVPKFDLKVGDEVTLSIRPVKGPSTNAQPQKFEISTTNWTPGYGQVVAKVIGWDGTKPLLWITVTRPHYNPLGWELRTPHQCTVDPKYQYLHSQREAARVTLLHDPSAFRRVTKPETVTGSVTINGHEFIQMGTTRQIVVGSTQLPSSQIVEGPSAQVPYPETTEGKLLVAALVEAVKNETQKSVKSKPMKQGQVMSTEKAQPDSESKPESIGARMKKQLERGVQKAPYRVARMKALTTGRKALLKTAKNNLNPGANAVVEMILNSQGGAGAILGLVGLAGTFSEKYRNNTHAQALCEEFVDEGIAMGANEALDFLIALVEPALESAMAAVPAVAEKAKPRKKQRVATPPPVQAIESEDEDIEVEDDTPVAQQMMT